MYTYHIHINGLVQGVGFRPFVYGLAHDLGIHGTVNNSIDGVHIYFSAEEALARKFFQIILSTAPVNSIITHSLLEKINDLHFSDFTIDLSAKKNNKSSSVLLTPDIAICKDCQKEIKDTPNRRYNYPFITCLNCGPRFSIIKDLPYDRENTTMCELKMCEQCNTEYKDPYDRRHFSQTNSCKDCAIIMHLYDTNKDIISSDNTNILERINEYLHQGKILALKGIGGYLLLCDATNEEAVHTLRKRKHRKAKPFAVLYPDLDLIHKDVEVSGVEEKALQEKAAPIVLCKTKSNPRSGIAISAIAPGLDKIGVMLPYTGLLLLLAESFGRPLVATSGNISGSPILFTDKDAIDNLLEAADYLITYDRDIIIPQDDSVIQFVGSSLQKIIIRRSRGLAPNYYPNPFSDTKINILAMGGELKSAFAFLHQENLYVSQFLGDQETLESQNSYRYTLEHVLNMISAVPQKILIDKHPGYTVSKYGRSVASELNIDITEIQHHKAHFAAVLAENNLLKTSSPVLGIVWDGIGYGDDKQIWGGEIFLCQKNCVERLFHLGYFPYLLGDKMSNEPRLSALSLLQDHPDYLSSVERYFTKTEWSYYLQFIRLQTHIQTSSMGRFLDVVASILDIQQINNYEGEAAMKLEVLARRCTINTSAWYPFTLKNNLIDHTSFINDLFLDIQNGMEKPMIAMKVFNSLAQLILQISNFSRVNKIAFSGGVFQNSLLVDIIIRLLSPEKELFFHRQLSPNDECIGFGQIAYYHLTNKT